MRYKDLFIKNQSIQSGHDSKIFIQISLDELRKKDVRKLHTHMDEVNEADEAFRVFVAFSKEKRSKDYVKNIICKKLFVKDVAISLTPNFTRVTGIFYKYYEEDGIAYFVLDDAEIEAMNYSFREKRDIEEIIEKYKLTDES